MIVYLITNKENGRQYVGQTIKPLDKRWKQHVRDAKRLTLLRFARAVLSYGPEEFELKVLHTCLSKEELDFIEIFYIRLLNTEHPNGYNMSHGGQIGYGYKGHKHSEETKKFLSEHFTGKGNANFGKPKSEETKRRMSEVQKGPKSYWFGKKASQETKDRLSKVRKGRKQSPEHIAARVKSRLENTKRKDT